MKARLQCVIQIAKPGLVSNTKINWTKCLSPWYVSCRLIAMVRINKILFLLLTCCCMSCKALNSFGHWKPVHLTFDCGTKCWLDGCHNCLWPDPIIRQHCHCLCLCPFWSQVNLTKQHGSHYHFIFIFLYGENMNIYGFMNALAPLFCLFVFSFPWHVYSCFEVCVRSYVHEVCLTNLSISLCPMQEKIDVILTTACHSCPRWTSNELRTSTFELHTSLQHPLFTLADCQ